MPLNIIYTYESYIFYLIFFTVNHNQITNSTEAHLLLVCFTIPIHTFMKKLPWGSWKKLFSVRKLFIHFLSNPLYTISWAEAFQKTSCTLHFSSLHGWFIESNSNLYSHLFVIVIKSVCDIKSTKLIWFISNNWSL